MVFEAQIDKELSTLLEPYRTARETYATLSHDPVVASLLEQANIVSITRMGYNDHGNVQAKIVATSDGTDMTKGRARIPAKTSKPDIHQFSALAVEHVEITKGDKKPIRIKIEMNDTAGVFQIEHQLVQKITDVGFEDHVEIVGTIRNGPTVTYFM